MFPTDKGKTRGSKNSTAGSLKENENRTRILRIRKKKQLKLIGQDRKLWRAVTVYVLKGQKKKTLTFGASDYLTEKCSHRNLQVMKHG